MKKILSLFLSLIMSVTMLGVSIFSEDTAPASDATVYITISDKGVFKATDEAVTVKDRDSDGKLTVDEALFAVHEAMYEGGATAGYESYAGEYGLSLGKLWGDTSGAFGYYINRASAFSLTDEVHEGDHVTAFVYKDTTTWSDKYSYFDKYSAVISKGDDLSLVLSSIGFDAEFNTVTLPVVGAVITIDGVATEYVTDNDGKVTIKLENAGETVISAVSDTDTLVPPVCKATVTENESDTSTDTTDSTTTVTAETTTEANETTTEATVTTAEATVTSDNAESTATTDIGKSSDNSFFTVIFITALGVVGFTVAFLAVKRKKK